MKQLDFFFDFFGKALQLKSGQQKAQSTTSIKAPAMTNPNPNKTLVFGGRREAGEILFLHGRQIRVRRKAYQRNLALTVKPTGAIHVTAARTIPMKMITKFVNDSWPWVLSQFTRFEELRVKHPPKRFEPGEYFSILGQDYCLKIRLYSSRRSFAAIEGDALVVTLAEKHAATQQMALANIRVAVRDFYEEHGRAILGQRVAVNSQKLQLYPQSVSYRCQKTRWGSCAPSGNISLNWRLVASPLEVVDYVVIHELCHLRFANHSKNFWKLVETQAPRWKKIRRWLHENQYAFDFLASESELHPN